jgi:hypothetical protein
MKIQSLVLTVMAALLIFSGDVLAAQGGGGGGGGGGVVETPDYGDLIILYRDAWGVPIPSPEVLVEDPETSELVDGGLCWQPIAFNVDDPLACPAICVVDSDPFDPDVPDVVDVNQYNCGVAEGCAGCTQEVDYERINVARSPDSVFESQLADVIVNLATADCLSLDPAGRIVTSRVVDDVISSSAIDSPLQNLAIYRQLMLTGDLGAPLPERAWKIITAARGLGAGSGKSGEVNVDLVAYLNSIMGLSDPATTTILDPKICEEYREEVKGVIQLVEKCYLNYENFNYNRINRLNRLPDPAYIPEGDAQKGFFEYLELYEEANPPVPALFYINQAQTAFTVFGPRPWFNAPNIKGFAQAADDTRAVIDFMHSNPLPDGYYTEVPCAASADTNYDLSISEESGLQVPMQMVDGGDGREFVVNVAHVGGDDTAEGTVTVTAIAEAGGAIEGSPWIFSFLALEPGASQSFTQFFTIDLGQQTTINWTAVVAAPDDVNLSNNTVEAVSNVIVTGGE